MIIVFWAPKPVLTINAPILWNPTIDPFNEPSKVNPILHIEASIL